MTTVRVPIRIRLEIAADRLDDPNLADLVGSAVAAASARAVDRARSVRVVAEAAGEVSSAPPSVCFSGDRLPQRLVDELVATLGGCAELAAARLSTPTAARGGQASTGERGEPLDLGQVVADQNRPDDDAYLVPSYDSQGRPVPVPLQGRRKPEVEAVPVDRRFKNFQNDDLWEAILDRFDGSPPPVLMVIVGDDKGDGNLILIRVSADGQSASTFSLGLIIHWQAATGTGSATATALHGFDADELRFVQRAAGPRERAELRAKAFFDILRADPRVAELSDDGLRKRAMDLAKQIPAGSGPSLHFQFYSGGRPNRVYETFDDIPPLTYPVATFYEEVEAQPANSDYGANCPDLDLASVTDWANSFGLTHPDPRLREVAFLSEMPIESWPPEISHRLRTQVNAIASQLHMTPTRFVGGFLIGAMTHIDQRCRNLVRSGAPLRYQIEEMAAAFGPITQLMNDYLNSMASLDDLKQLPCPLSKKSEEWKERFQGVFFAARDDAVASMFVSTCQDVLLQVLIATRKELNRRMEHFPSYMAATRQLMLILLAETPKLNDLREKVVAREQMAASALGGPGGSAMAAWLLVQEDLIEATRAGEPTVPGSVVRRNGKYRVLDEHGRWWSRAELDLLLSTQRQQALGVDALVDKIADLPDLVGRMQEAWREDNKVAAATNWPATEKIDKEFRDLLIDLRNENESRTKQVIKDRSIAFGLAKFERTDFGPESDIGFKLSGIYKLADDQLRGVFTDQDAYRSGLAQLAVTEVSKAEFIEFFSFVGLALLAVICPVAATAIGAVQALMALDDAFEHAGIQRAMLGGDEILSKAQAEAEMWGAVIGAALAFLPEVPSVARGARSVIKGEATEAAIAATRQAMKRVTAHLAEMSIEHFTKSFAKELVTMYVLNLALSGAIGRITTAVAEEVKRTGRATIGGLTEVGDPGQVGDLREIVERAINGATSSGGTP